MLQAKAIRQVNNQSFIKEFDKNIDLIDKYETLDLIYSKLKNDLNKLEQIQKKESEVEFSASFWRAKSKKESEILKGKRELKILLKFAEKNDINSIKKSFDNIWKFNSILKNQDLCKSIRELIEERESTLRESLTKEINNYIKSIQEAESKAKKHLNGYKNLEAYISGDALNVNINKSQQGNPIKINEIFKLEKEVNQFNIYCDYQEGLCAYKRDNKRYYEFKEGSYQMIINWPVKDRNGGDFGCTAIIAIGANGITNILKVQIDGEQLDLPNEIVDLAEQNKELYIQGLPLSEALRNFLGLSQGKTLKSKNGCSESIKLNPKPPSDLESVSSTQVKETIELA